MVDESRRVIVQGVYELFEKERSTEWHDHPRINRLVFIGIIPLFFLHRLCNSLSICDAGYNLDREILLQSFKKFCL